MASKNHTRLSDKFIEYGTAGFRSSVDFLQALGWKLAEYGDSLQSLVTMHLAWKQIHSIKRHHMSRENFFELPATDLDHVIYRMGLLAVLRSKYRKATIGVMITASHNPEEDNGVKLVDPDGEMIESSWEKIATNLANISDEKLQETLESIFTEIGIDKDSKACVVFARDTRASSECLSQSLQDGISELGSEFKDYGVLTTPQLHYMVKCINSEGLYGVPSETGYYSKMSNAFLKLNSSPSKLSAYKPTVWIDCANGVGAPKLADMMHHVGNTLNVVIYNDGKTGRLNHMCGADYVKIQQAAPEGMPTESGQRCASFDGDADRLIYFFANSSGHFKMLDGDKIATLIASYIGELVESVGLSLKIGVVQTAYANGASTSYITDTAKIPVACVPTGVKHLHHRAQEFDAGVYFEANGHGTVLFSNSATEQIKAVTSDPGSSESQRSAAQQLMLFIDLINQTVGDAISDFLVVETVLRHRDWDVETWNNMYTDLPNRQLKVKVKDRTVIQTADAERKVVSPDGLQSAIDAIVSKYERARSFVRPSGTEDIVRIYAESNTQVNADVLAYEVSLAVYDLAGGCGERPKHPA